MVIHPDQKWCFVSTMKCATNTLYEILPKIGGHKVQECFHPRPTIRLADIHFTVCRNPYSRAVSIWASTCLRDGDRYNAIKRIKSEGGDPNNFDDFCKYCLVGDPRIWTPHEWLFRNQHSWWDTTIIDRILHMENLHQELQQIVGKIPELPTKNKSDHNPWAVYTSPDAIEIINQWAPRDFLLGYDKL